MKKITFLLIFILSVILAFSGKAQTDSTAFLADASRNTRATTPLTQDLQLNSFTIETWVFRPPGSDNTLEDHIIEAYAPNIEGGMILRINRGLLNGYVYKSVGNPISVEDPSPFRTPVPINQWVHLAFTFNTSDNMATIYQNGVAQFSVEVANWTAPTTWPSDIQIGARGDDVRMNQDIIIDELRIWDKSLTETEINDTKDSCLNGNETGLLLYYDFEDVSGDTIYDKSSFGHHARVVNGDSTYITDGVFSCSLDTLPLDTSDPGDPIGLTEPETLTIKIFPNPANSFIYINHDGGEVLHYEILDVTGRMHYSGRVNAQIINTETTNKGVYIVQVKDEGGKRVHSERIIIQ